MDVNTAPTYLAGKMLLAMPSMTDPRFDRTAIYLCVHDENGAWGLVINRALNGLGFGELLSQLDITAPKNLPNVLVHEGGPVEPGRGFVLHNSDYAHKSSLKVDDTASLTATVDILSAIADGGGPDDFIITLGYAGWSAGQLEREIGENAWMIADASSHLIFATAMDDIWTAGIQSLGIDVHQLSSLSGHA